MYFDDIATDLSTIVAGISDNVERWRAIARAIELLERLGADVYFRNQWRADTEDTAIKKG